MVQINKIRYMIDVGLNTTKLQRITRDYKPIRWATWKKWTILKKRYNLPRLNQDKTENMN